MSTSNPWAIYIRPGGRYVVKRLDESISGLWAQLGSEYTHETAQKLADSLTRDEKEQRHEAKARRYAKAYGASPTTIAEIVERERARRAGEQDRGASSEKAECTPEDSGLGVSES